MKDLRAGWHRRAWLQTTISAVCLGRTANASSRLAEDPIEQIQARARGARMQPFETTTSDHFQAIGDASQRHRQDALELAESFAPDYFAHFRGKGFTLAWPPEKLPIVVLANPTSYAAFDKNFVDEALGGHFDLDHNWLVTFDFRSPSNHPRAVGSADPRLDNTLSLVHELFHQLSYNTGMLNRKTDLPLCLTEGLAEYAETWRPGRKQDPIGARNLRRRLGLEQGVKEGVGWIKVADLLTNDPLQDGEKTVQVARGESWLLVYRLLKDPTRLTQFRAYIKAVQAANDPTRRLELATAQFGDLDKLDREIRRV